MLTKFVTLPNVTVSPTTNYFGPNKVFIKAVILSNYKKREAL